MCNETNNEKSLIGTFEKCLENKAASSLFGTERKWFPTRFSAQLIKRWESSCPAPHCAAPAATVLFSFTFLVLGAAWEGNW